MLNGYSKYGASFTRWLAVGSLLLAVSCASDTVRVTGEVWRIRGNQMPSPDLPDPTYPGYKTTIYFFLPVNVAAAKPVGTGGMYSQINGELAATAASNDKGLFRLRLTPGKYSVIIGNDSLYYSNIRDGSGVLHPVEIPKKKSFHLQLRADWDASY